MANYRWGASVVIFLIIASIGCAGKRPVAIVGGQPIDEASFRETMTKMFGAATLRWLIQRQLLLQVNEKERLVSDQDVERAFKDWIRHSGFQDEHQALSFLARQGLDKETILDQQRMEMILFALRERAVKPDDKKLKEFYEKNRQAFAFPPEVRAYIIQSKDRKTLEKAKDLAAKGEDFRELAYRFNESPHLRSSRGFVSLPLVHDTHAPPSLLELLARSRPNQVVGPVQIPETGLFVLVKVVEIQPPMVPPFDDIKAMVRQRFVEASAPPPQEIFKQLAAQSQVLIPDERFKFLEDEIRTAGILAPSSVPFQPPAAPPGASQPPLKEGEKLQERAGQ
ncbi:MAG: peptidyl-prolyl cis-trans isomerase [Armatimonadetes bacterium]|nr:peptidyl-prolyl cis-trans isomerase [Armatimonadota bacterium]MDW8121807.1 peptidyl-prolyl cis-trans isomerase [Armatimonadota bacterium]